MVKAKVTKHIATYTGDLGITHALHYSKTHTKVPSYTVREKFPLMSAYDTETPQDLNERVENLSKGLENVLLEMEVVDAYSDDEYVHLVLSGDRSPKEKELESIHAHEDYMARREAEDEARQLQRDLKDLERLRQTRPELFDN